MVLESNHRQLAFVFLELPFQFVQFCHDVVIDQSRLRQVQHDLPFAVERQDGIAEHDPVAENGKVTHVHDVGVVVGLLDGKAPGERSLESSPKPRRCGVLRATKRRVTGFA